MSFFSHLGESVPNLSAPPPPGPCPPGRPLGYGHDLVWPRPCLATTLLALATSPPDFGDNLELADLGLFRSGGTNLDQLWPPALFWPIWAMALLILGGQPDFGRARPIWANLATRLDLADFWWPHRFRPTDPPPPFGPLSPVRTPPRFGPPPGSDHPLVRTTLVRTALRRTALRRTALHRSALVRTALRRTALRRTALHRTALRRTAQNFTLFFPLLGVFSLNFGGVLKTKTLKCATFGVLGLSCASPGDESGFLMK